MSWKKEFETILPLLGHRNWILVVDKAYPMQSADGIETIYTGEKLIPVLKYVLNSIQDEHHVKPIIYTDKELLFMRDDLSKGIDDFKANLAQALAKQKIEVIPHEEIFAKLDEASKLFNVLVLKTDSLMPYTSVFMELDCGYWSTEREKILRERIS
ncbi:MAG TPA: RbsD/FucU domain-containing protein [Bacteroidales bacterium]|nr:RbsD/FucU domain-containing protein [Bacteroidales bacterium]